ncbi:unnamed protein product [Clavelina lepadiformis]|uniref:Uncharacterized protein n=1 Tax=Clavelina lepadiformis TaxID=159417 RepID=A0ABP0EVA1_CLALP
MFAGSTSVHSIGTKLSHRLNGNQVSKWFFFILSVQLLLSTISAQDTTVGHPVGERSASTPTTTPTSTSEPVKANTDNNVELSVKCESGSCFIRTKSSEKVTLVGVDYTKKIFEQYLDEDGNFTVSSLKNFMENVGVLKVNGHEDHDHGEHEDHDEPHDHEETHDHNHENSESGNHAHKSDELEKEFDYSYLDFFFMDYEDKMMDYSDEDKKMCLQTPEDVLSEFYSNTSADEVRITLSDFSAILPRIIFDLQSPECTSGSGSDSDAEEHHESEAPKNNRGEVWAITLGSVAIISALSVIGIIIVPLMSKSKFFNRFLSLLVSLAVGTLVGDALLHLLPHATGGHDHGAHDHGSESDEKDTIMKNLVAVLGIYIFFVFESGMGLLRKYRRNKRKEQESKEKKFPSPKSDECLIMHDHVSVDPLLVNSKKKSPNQVDTFVVESSHDSGLSLSNGAVFKFPNAREQVKVKRQLSNGTRTPPFPLDLDVCENGHASEATTDSPSSCQQHHENETAHVLVRHHHQDHHHHHHHHPDLSKAQGVKDLAWMIIMGDGLHNFSDGLAIGAAFSSSIAAGLSTSLAIFCHELPHELGDFAILIDAGMSIKKALLYNGMCACLAFVGAIIGLVIGEYTVTVKLWILAITAGGFLYVGLVDMLSQMLQHCAEEDGLSRFIFQNVGFLGGVTIMLLIALYEDSFMSIFASSGV